MPENRENLLSPYQYALSVYDCWILSLYIKMGIWRQVIPDQLFDMKIEIMIGQSRWAIIPNREQRNMKGVSDNLVRMSQGTCFIAFDEALNNVFGAKSKNFKNDIDSLRAIIYILRCAFAHTPSTPKWCIKPKYKRVFEIREISFSIDFSNLDGKELQENDHGGLHNLLKLTEYCLSVLRYNETKSK
jgi:hypothetical protein